MIMTDANSKNTKASRKGNMSKLLNAIKGTGKNVKSNVELTANGAISNASTQSKVLDFFGQGGALRNKDAKYVVDLFKSAFYENAQLALKSLFYFRDVRGGQGERKLFRTLLNWLGNEHPEIVEANIENIPFYGRFDDLYDLFNTTSESKVLEFIASVLTEDVEKYNKGEEISIAAKWIASCNTSSAITRAQGQKIRQFLGLDERTYRKTLAALRTKLNLVEKNLCTKDYTSINYSHVPSQATKLYRNAFKKHDATRYTKWQSDVKSGKKGVKVNASVLYPYDIVREARSNFSGLETLDLQWNALPNYMKGSESVLTIVDTSGSMTSGLSGNVQPIDVAVSLGIYCAERAKGPFKDHFITFSTVPTLQKVEGNNIREKVKNLCNAHWSMSTNLQAAFELILNTAVKSRLKQEDLPSTLLIVSDLEFNSCGSLTNYQTIKQKFEAKGYTLPKVVFWRVNALTNQAPVLYNETNTALVSGFSPSILQYLFNWEIITPYDQMLKVLNSERYNRVVVPSNSTAKSYKTVKKVSNNTSELIVKTVKKQTKKFNEKSFMKVVLRDKLGRFAKAK